MASASSIQKLRVSDEGLHMEGGSTEYLASKLTANSAPTGVGSSGLASAATITAAIGEVAAANIRCTFRVQATAAKLQAAANGYTETDGESVAQLQALKKRAVY
jgi:hypothetical protein